MPVPGGSRVTPGDTIDSRSVCKVARSEYPSEACCSMEDTELAKPVVYLPPAGDVETGCEHDHLTDVGFTPLGYSFTALRNEV